MAGRICNNLIEVRQGDSFAINVCVRQKCAPADLRGATIRMQVRDEANNIMIEVLGTPVDAQNGKMVLLLTPQMTGIEVGDYVTDIQVTTADGSVNTIFPANVSQVGTFRITPQVTQ